MSNDQKKSWWQPSLVIFARVSMWVAGPLVVAVILGKYLDTKFQTKPLIFIGLIVLAFLVTCFQIVKIIKGYIRKMEIEARSKK